MNDEKRIAELFRCHGDVVAPDDFDEAVGAGLQGQLELYRTLAPDIPCVFLGSMAFNAVAIPDKDRCAIGINIGAATLIARYAYCLMSDPEMFPNIGDPSCEQVDPYVIGRLRDSAAAATDYVEDYGRYLPRDPTRLEAAKQLSIAAYLMLFFHEVNHVQLGHLGFMNERFGAMEYREITFAPVTEEEAAVRRALEWDADASALYRSLKVWRTIYPMFEEPAIAALTPEDSWFVAVELLFWIMDFVQPRAHVGPLATHPSAVARRINVTDITSKVDWVPTMNGDASPLIPWIIRNAFPSVALTDERYGNLDRVERELAETRDQLAVLLPALEPHSRLPRGKP